MAKAFGEIAAKALRSAEGKAESRTRMIGAVRAASRRLRICDEDRKAIQLEVTGKASMSEMTLAEIGQVLDRLNRDYKGPMGHRAHVGKIRALWWTLYWLGAVSEPNDSALDAFVARQTNKERIQFLGSREAFSVIEALKKWAEREGVAWPDQARLDALRQTSPGLDMPRLERHAVLGALGVKLRELRVLHASAIGYCEKSLGLSCNHWSWDARQLDQAIRFLGKKVRHAIGKAVSE